MKQLLTYLMLIICIYANAQRAEDLQAKTEELNKYKTEWRVNIENRLLKLTKENQAIKKDLNNAVSRLNYQSDQLTQLTIKSWRDSLRIEQMSKRLEYTQSFIKDTVVFLVDSVKSVTPNNNLLGNVSSMHAAWSDNEDSSYSYDHTIANYQYLYFNLKENLKPKTTYIISFTIELSDPNRESIINLWFYDDSGNTRLSDTYYGEGKHTIEVEFDVEKFSMAFRARNNDGGSFKLVNPKIEEKQ